MSLLRSIGDKGLLFMLKRNVAAEAYGISLAVFGNDPSFVPVMRRALELLSTHDQRRFRRVLKHVRWIYDGPESAGPGCASYLPRIRACRIDFQMNPALGDELVHAAGYAGLIVHEATHGVIEARHTKRSSLDAERVERLCYAEQARFLRKMRELYPTMPATVDAAYDPNLYDSIRTSSKFSLFLAEARRGVRKIAEPDGPADGGQPSSSETNRISGAAGPHR